MNFLRMNGRKITNLDKFYAEFNPIDALLQKESFSAFAGIYCRRISEFDTCCEEICRNIVKNFEFVNKEIKFENPVELFWGTGHTTDDTSEKIVLTLFELIDKTDLTFDEKYKIYLFITSAYLLAHANPDDTPLNIERVKRIIRGTETNSQSNNKESNSNNDVLISPGNSDYIELIAGNDIKYHFNVYEAMEFSPDERIRTIKICAVRAPNTIYNSAADIVLFSSSSNRKREIKLRHEEFIYVNVIGNYITKILDTNVYNNGHVMERGDLTSEKIYSINSDGERRLIDSSIYTNTSCFAPEEYENKYLFVQKNRLKAMNYSGTIIYKPVIDSIEEKNIVEVKIICNNFLILQDTGRVYSSKPEWDKLRRISTLDKITENGGF
jgi:hypothetical protein